MPGNTVLPPIRILMVEDNESDAYLMAEALKAGNLNPRITTVEDGEAAIDYLFKKGIHAATPSPDLILLDLHLPRKNGYEVLTEIKEDRLLRRIPVIILTASENEQALVKAYDLHANCCVCKPIDQDEFALAVQKIEHFWLHIARRVRGPDTDTEG